jgi:hypothetical protein
MGGPLSRVTHGWYADAGEVLDLARRCRAFLAALPDDAVVSDSTAALLHGLPLPGPWCEAQSLHVTIPPRTSPPQRKSLVVHRRALPAHGVCTSEGLRMTTAAQTFLDLSISLTSEDLAAVGDAILFKRLADHATLADAVAEQRRRRGLRVARSVLPRLDGRAQSRPETILRLRMAAAGIALEPQCPVVDQSGVTVGHSDLGGREARVAVEYEGRQHAGGEQFDYDIERYSRFAAAGWLVIRCGRRDLVDSSAVIWHVQQAIASRLRR